MRVIERLEFITRSYVKANPQKIFLFGDNMLRQGYGGQAREMRGEPNCIGVVTKRFPSNWPSSFLYDRDFEEAKVFIDMDFERIPSDCTVVIPFAGLGTGLARLDETAPMIYSYILDKIAKLHE